MADARLYEMLKNPDAAKRKAAIQALARSKDPEAIPYLERVVDNDDDEAIRDIAEKAIVYINRNNPDAPQAEPKRQTPAPSAPVSASGNSMPADSIGGFVQVNRSEEERARRLLNTALDLNMREQNAKAVKAVVEAFQANPNLKNDGYARGVASTATGLQVAEAVEKVLDGSALELFEPKKGTKAKRGGGGAAVGDLPTRDSDGREAGAETEVSFGSAMLDLFIYGLVNAVIVGGSLFLLLYLLVESIPPSFLNEPMAQGVPYTFGEAIDLFNSIGVTLLLVYSVAYGLLQMLGMFLQTGVVHWAATNFMKGEGSFSELLHRLSVFYTLIVPLAFILPFVVGFIEGYISATSGQVGGEASPIGNLVSLGISIYAIWGSSVRVGKTYNFGTGNGCLSILVGGVVLGGLCCLLIFGLSYLVGSGLTGVVPSP